MLGGGLAYAPRCGVGPVKWLSPFFNIGSFYWIVALPTWIAQFVFLEIWNPVKLFKQASVGKNS